MSSSILEMSKSTIIINVLIVINANFHPNREKPRFHPCTSPSQMMPKISVMSAETSAPRVETRPSWTEAPRLRAPLKRLTTGTSPSARNSIFTMWSNALRHRLLPPIWPLQVLWANLPKDRASLWSSRLSIPLRTTKILNSIISPKSR